MKRENDVNGRTGRVVGGGIHRKISLNEWWFSIIIICLMDSTWLRTFFPSFFFPFSCLLVRLFVCLYLQYFSPLVMCGADEALTPCLRNQYEFPQSYHALNWPERKLKILPRGLHPKFSIRCILKWKWWPRFWREEKLKRQSPIAVWGIWEF